MKINRKLATLATTAAIVLGGLAVAPSAVAAEVNAPTTRQWWAGGLQCPSNQRVSDEGARRAGAGTFYLIVPGRIIIDHGTEAARGRWQGTSSSGSWEVSGSAATWGHGFCG